MMIAKDDLLWRNPKAFSNVGLEPQPAAKPGAHGPRKLREASRPRPQLLDHDALKLAKRVFIKDDPVDVIDAQVCLVEHKGAGPLRKASVVLNSREAFFLGGRNDAPLAHKGGRGVVKVSTDAKRFHAALRG